MTIEEKAKAYDEAIEAARKELKQDLHESGVWAIKRIFPELRESEDKKIRNWLIFVFDSRNEKFVEELDNYCGNVTREQILAYLEKQKEQKPIRWTDLTWKDIVELEGIINNVNYEFRNGIGQESFGKEVLEKFREYKGDEYLDEIEQKPAKWSEEDKVIIDCAVEVVEKDGLPSLAASLKSLRPSWKPSEEQMDALLNTLYPDDPYYNELKSLHEHLKKLM